MKTLLLFPHNLFTKELLPNIKNILLVEDPIFFGDKERITNMSQLKLVLHRASMKYYQNYLEKSGYQVTYIEYAKAKKYNYFEGDVTIFDPVDHLLMERIGRYADNLNVMQTPLFLLSSADLDDYGVKEKYRHSDFYRWMINRLQIPHIRKSHDKENRKPIPKGTVIPQIKPVKSKYVEEAIRYVKKHFGNNYGEADNFILPVTHKDAEKWLDSFLKQRLHSFGTYQDAILQDESYLFHSLIAPLLNIGLLTPKQVVNKAVAYYNKNKKKIKINNYEGFIRQVVGWREYMRMLYRFKYSELVSANRFGNRRKLSKKFYTGSTGIEVIDDTIQKAFATGYLHHIERLMIMMNFMILCEIDPNQIYKWFMEFSMDSYDWVMVGNVYGMGGFSDCCMSRPYISSSNYIEKMSDYSRSDIFDALFYRFIQKNDIPFYKRNLYAFRKKSQKEQREIIGLADKFIKRV